MSRSVFAFVSFAAILMLTPRLGIAQVAVTRPPVFPNASLPAGPLSSPAPGVSANGPGDGSPMMPSFPTPGNALPTTLPPGIGHLWGMEGTNEILLYGTQAGYDLARQLIRDLDGDSDIDQTVVQVARETPDYLQSLGVVLGPGGALTTADAQTLQDAWRGGKITTSHTLKVTSGDGEAIDATLDKNAGSLPFSLTTTAPSVSQILIRFTSPVHVSLTLRPGQTAVVAVPPDGSENPPIVSLLFVSAGIVKRG